jgi:site-specific DNA-methyltransferase (adenine-specific)
MQEMNVIYKNIKELKPYKKNAKKHPKEQVERIANSIKEFGFTQPVIVDKNNEVVAGHGRILGAKKAGLKSVPTVCLEDLTEEQIKAYRLVDNKLNESEWDYGLLDEELENLTEDIDMNLFGFDENVDLTNAFEYETKDKVEKNFFVVSLAFPKDEKEVIMKYLNKNKEKVQEIIRKKAGIKL